MADNKDTQVYEVTFSSPEFKTLGEYLSDQNSPAFQYQNSPDDFLKVLNKNGISNRDAIFNRYLSQKAKDTNAKLNARDLPLKVGTKLAIETQKVNRAGLLTEGIEVVSNDIPAFKAKALADLEENEGYTIVQQLRPIAGKLDTGVTKEEYPDMTVWIWCRALSVEQDFSYQGQIFNITPFVQKCSTNVGKNGGNFELTLPPLLCEYENGKWVIKRKHLQRYKSGATGTSLQNDGYVAEGSLYSLNEDRELIRNTFLFHNLIDTNDVVFIRYETLEMEKADRSVDQERVVIDKKDLPGKIYDMIGLVDMNAIGVNPSSNDVTINISGRDLSKLIIEDGTYFYALEMSQGKLNFAGGSTAGNDLIQRVISDNALQYLNLYYNNSIENVFKFVIQQLSSIKVVPNELFEAYGDRRNTKYNQEKDQVTEQKPIADQLNEQETIAKNAIASVRKVGELTLPTQAQENVKIQEIFNEKKRFLQAIRDKKVRKVENGYTKGWAAFTYINERGVPEKIEENVLPQYFVDVLYKLYETRVVNEGIPIVNAIDRILDIEAAQPKYKTQFRQQLANGIWQIIKLVIDKGVTERRLVDSSMSSANGSLLNFFRKICQEPFVEFYMDTYSDMFYFIARKPPYDRSGILSMLKGQEVTEDGDRVRSISPVIDIEASDVLSEQLAYDDRDVASWYHITPQANLIGFGDAYSLAYLPAIYFPEYAEIWGSKPMQLVHNYMPYIPINSKDSDLDLIEKQAIEDIKFMIESNAYLPFTRKGTIVTNGDRRYKVGNMIRYKPTGEVFFIDAVQQQWSISDTTIDRTSTLQVSRGMVEQLIYGIPAVSQQTTEVNSYISYFNIINTTPKFSYTDGEERSIQRVKIGDKVIKQADTGPVVQTTPPFGLSAIRDDQVVERGNINIYELNKYRPYEKSVFTRFINALNARGYWVNITSGVRTYEEQKALWLQNKQNAAPGSSRHETGRAMDINLINKTTGQTHTKTSSKAGWIATGAIELATALGLNWAGGDGSFYGRRGEYIDRVHFEIRGNGAGGTVTTEPIFEEREVVTKKKVLNRAEIFSNFKVNKSVFNFFLRRQQASKQFSKVTSKTIYGDNGPELQGVTIRPQ